MQCIDLVRELPLRKADCPDYCFQTRNLRGVQLSRETSGVASLVASSGQVVESRV